MKRALFGRLRFVEKALLRYDKHVGERALCHAPCSASNCTGLWPCAHEHTPRVRAGKVVEGKTSVVGCWAVGARARTGKAKEKSAHVGQQSAGRTWGGEMGAGRLHSVVVCLLYR